MGFCEQLPIEDLCSLTSQSLTVTLTAAVPESTEDVLLKGFAILGMEDERIETAQQVSDAESNLQVAVIFFREFCEFLCFLHSFWWVC